MLIPAAAAIVNVAQHHAPPRPVRKRICWARFWGLTPSKKSLGRAGWAWCIAREIPASIAMLPSKPCRQAAFCRPPSIESIASRGSHPRAAIASQCRNDLRPGGIPHRREIRGDGVDARVEPFPSESRAERCLFKKHSKSRPIFSRRCGSSPRGGRGSPRSQTRQHHADR